MNGQRDRPGPGRVIGTAASALISATLPLFLLGALAPRISADLGVDEVAIGGLVAVFFLSGAVCSIPGGRLTDRVGSTAALRIGAALAGTIALAIAATGRTFAALLVLFVLGGAMVPLADTGGARAISSGVPLHRQGLAFGGKEASIPVASLLAGLTVPILGAQLGWRPAYLVAAVIAVTVAVIIPRGLDLPGPGSTPVAGPAGSHTAAEAAADVHQVATSVPEAPAPPATTGRALVLLAVASGLAGAAGNSAPTFLVSSGVSAGMTEAAAGVLLAVASVAGIASRLASGVAADRRGGSERRIMAGLMITGGLGMGVLAVGGTSLTVIGALLTFGGGWGWTGLAFFAAVRLRPDRPARAAGAILAGLASGGALGPLAFGAVAAGPGYPAAWSVAGAAMVSAGLLSVAADRLAAR